MERRKAVYFFGAGASAAESPVAPTNTNLLKGGLSRRQGKYQTLQRFLTDWGFSDFQFLPSIEELLSILDNCLSKGEPIGQRWSISDLTRCREELVTCIYDVIGDTLDSRSNGSSEQGLYEQLIRQLPGEDVSLISLNYDLLLDTALHRSGRTPNYSLDFLDFAGEPGHETVVGPHPARGDIKLFKLHGSINWGYCPSCYTTVFTRDQKISHEQVCPTCNGLLTALIVPPTPMKVPPSPFLSALWKKAEWELSQAKEIVFIGYSLSDADANIRYLLFRGFFGYTPKVTVVLKQNPPDYHSPVVGRYHRLFPGGVAFFWGGFEAFANR
ncbi:MAG TPA: SIR2 family protein [Stenomitos sp.]